MKKINQSTKGFTLIELLAVLAVFGVVGSIAATIMVTSLRTSRKATVITNAKENGNFVVSQMTKIIREAVRLNDPYPCVYPQPTPVPVINSITVTALDGGTVTYSCNGNSDTPPNTIASNGASLLDTNTVKLVDMSCQLTCSQQGASDYPIIGISFTLVPATTSTLQEQNASPVTFSTSVLMRNFNR